MSGDLEGRYRRLLAWYPWSHRRMYEEEMLAVLVAGARPGQRRPTVGETADLVASGLRARARTAVTSFVNPAWVDAAAVVGLLTALVLLSQRAVRLLEAEIIYPYGSAEPEMYLRAAGWAAVLLATVIGLRRVAAVLAWVTVLGEAVPLTMRYESDPVSTIHALWPLVLAMTAAAALTVPAIYLVPVQWVLLVAVPLTALPIGALLVQRREHKARLIALGRSADREGPDTA